MKRGHRRIASFVTIGGTAILSLVALRIAADRLPIPGLKTLSNYVTGSAGGGN